MLLSLVLALTPTKPFRPSGFYGRYARAWFLKEVDRHEPALAKALHAGDGSRPYTVSDLWCEERRMEPGDVCYLRLTSVAAPLTDFLLDGFVQALPDFVRLGDIFLKPLGRATWHAWDGSCTFEELMTVEGDDLPPRVTLHFASPTAFRSQGTDMVLPVPELVWRSLYHQWQTFAPPIAHIHELWPSFVGAGIAVSDFRLQSQKVIFKRGQQGAATGGTGYATYRLLPARHCGDYAEVRQGAEAVLHTLGAFAHFCGLGHHTAIGLGQARAVEDLAEVEGGVMTPRYRNAAMG